MEGGAASTAPIRSYLKIKVRIYGAYFDRITLVCKDQQQTAAFYISLYQIHLQELWLVAMMLWFGEVLDLLVV